MITGAMIGAGLFFMLMLAALVTMDSSREKVSWSKVAALATSLTGTFAFWGWVFS